MTYLAVLPVQQVGAMWTALAADEVHLFPTSVDETATHEDMKLMSTRFTGVRVIVAF